MIRGIGEITDSADSAELVVKDITEGFASLDKAIKSKRVVYFIWRNPWMSAGGDTFINNMIEKINFDHIIPLSKFGVNDPTNIQLLCNNCNSKKLNRNTEFGTKYQEWF